MNLSSQKEPTDIPEHLEGWEDTFEIPKYFGNDTVMTQLRNGVITDSVKNRITQEVHSLQVTMHLHSHNCIYRR